MSTGSRQEKAAIEAAIDRVTRLAKELRSQDLSGIQERWDPRIEAIQKRINNALGDVLGHGSAEFKALKVGALESTLDTSFGDRYSSEELHASIRKGLDGAIAHLNEAAKVLDERLHGGAFPGAQAATAPAPTAAPTPAPTQAPPPAPTAAPSPAPTAAPTAAPTPAPTTPPAPTKAAAPAAKPVSSPEPAAAPAPARVPASTKPSKTPMPSSAPSPAPTSSTARRVAIVSSIGDDAAASVAAYVRQLGLEAVPVGDAPVADDTAIVDRLESVRGCDYALVLAPASALAAEPAGHGARAEVLLEAGFLFGLLGRRKVCYLLEGKAPLAPELQDVVQVHTRDDANLWHLLVAREMRKSGLDVDMNRAV